MEPNYISNEEKEVCQQLLKLDQGHLIASLSSFKDEERKEFVEQINKLNKTYPGGIESYITRAKKLLIDSANDVNPYEGFVPSVPKGKSLDFYNEKEINELEAIGLQELQHTCFVLVAGGLGERLGYNGIKISIPIELLTRKCFLQYYIEYILAFQEKSGAKSPIPLAIMVSDDTHDLTVKLLEDNNNFGMPKNQLTIMKQEKVPALLDNMGHFSQKPNSLLVDTKPHGHGDVHTLLYMSGLAKKWGEEGRKWICFFQDTNPLVFRSYPAVLGVSKSCNFEVNSITIPRKTGEAVGAICFLKNDKLQKDLTINVEYNQLDPLMKTFGGEPKDANGFSVYPGNTNGLVFSLPDYLPVLLSTQGLISEFINPKYTDNTKTKFKSPTRLECMMQDYPKLLKSGDRVGFTQIDRRFCFSTAKNDLKTASQKVKSGLPAECSSICEHELYWLNKEILKLCGVEFEAEKEETKLYADIPIPITTRVVLHPSFGVTLSEIKAKIKGKNLIHSNSNLILDADIKLENFKLKGSVRATKDLVNVEIDNKVQLQLTEINVEDPKVAEYLKIRGYDLLGTEKIVKV